MQKTEDEKFKRISEMIMKYFRKLSPDNMKIVEDEIVKVRKTREKIFNRPQSKD